jgi:hypothetical protein
MKRPKFFGQLMPKEPTDEILVDKYHNTNKAYDKYPEKHNSIVGITGDSAICHDGERLPLSDKSSGSSGDGIGKILDS